MYFSRFRSTAGKNDTVCGNFSYSKARLYCVRGEFSRSVTDYPVFSMQLSPFTLRARRIFAYGNRLSSIYRIIARAFAIGARLSGIFVFVVGFSFLDFLEERF